MGRLPIEIFVLIQILCIGCSNKELSLKNLRETSIESQTKIIPKTCLEIKDFDSAALSGTYTIDPDGSLGEINPFKVWCDMITDGGGWTLVRKTVDIGSRILATNQAVNPNALSSIDVDDNAQIHSDVVNILGDTMMAINIDLAGIVGGGKIWLNIKQAKNCGMTEFHWAYDSSGVIVTTCFEASSIYSPSENKWGVDTGSMPLNNNVDGGPFTHGLCFGNLTAHDLANPSVGHICFDRNGETWWNNGPAPSGSQNTQPKTLVFVR